VISGQKGQGVWAGGATGTGARRPRQVRAAAELYPKHSPARSPEVGEGGEQVAGGVRLVSDDEEREWAVERSVARRRWRTGPVGGPPSARRSPPELLPPYGKAEGGGGQANTPSRNVAPSAKDEPSDTLSADSPFRIARPPLTLVCGGPARRGKRAVVNERKWLWGRSPVAMLDFLGEGNRHGRSPPQVPGNRLDS
jgi:hypothetical protein